MEVYIGFKYCQYIKLSAMDVLILGGSILGSPDPVVHLVANKLIDMGVELCIFDMHNSKDFTLNVSSSGAIDCTLKNNTIFSPYIVWNRVKIPEIHSFDAYKDREKQVKDAQWTHIYAALSLIYSDKAINKLSDMQKFTQKIWQMHTAAQCGLNIPSSIVTNCRKSAIQFQKKHKNIITKGVGDIPVISECDDNAQFHQHIMTTSRVEYKYLYTANDDDFHEAPVFFQEEIEKKYELRIISFIDDYIAFHIGIKDPYINHVDWRVMELNNSVEYKKINIDQQLQDKLSKFLKLSNLYYGVFDIIIDEDETPWFLECNPDGQWAACDFAANGVVSDLFARKFAELLAERKSL